MLLASLVFLIISSIQAPTFSTWLLCGLGKAHIVLLLVSKRLSPEWRWALAGILLTVELTLLCSYIMPTSWVGHDEWEWLYETLSHGHFTIYDRPPLLMLALEVLLLVHTFNSRFVRLASPMVLTMALSMMGAQLWLQLQTSSGPSESISLWMAAGLMLLALYQTRPWLAADHPGATRLATVLALGLSSTFMLSALGYWHFQNVQTQYRLERTARQISDNVLEHVSQSLENHHRAMSHLTSAWSMLERPPSQDQWDSLAVNFNDDFGYQALLAFVSPSGVITRVATRGIPPRTGLPFNQLMHPLSGNAPLSPGADGYTDVIDLKGMGPSVMFYLPSRDSRGVIFGATLSVIALAPLLSTLTTLLGEEHVVLNAYEHGRQIYRLGPAETPAEASYCNVLSLGQEGITLCTTPTRQRLAREYSSMPDIVLVVGLIFSLMMFVLFQLNRRLNAQHMMERDARDALEQEAEQRRELQQAIEWMAHHDDLTGLANRRHFMNLAGTWREDAGITLLMIDLDHFKAINDTLGHQQGDHVLAEVARALKLAIDVHNGLIARYGGEEFMALVPGIDPSSLTDLATSLREAVSGTGLIHPATERPITVSIGMATGTAGALNGLIQRADTALYQAKRAGRNRAVLSPPGG
ncbi:GGDEF domain-containing protein [Larsenimonas rhizosphaerae]|uniref:GGDEF domain-containing protein n=1 Tax=Larsenimonas rhizosphaerae TaxID=2944682 RepID=UPI0020334812|nr:GGDEF domain-containing protein [Larsenimonas rhizosphaerae]MCM2130099.1 GGDEF domain-containing protein [Larsenimonas rhizosphaerae]